MLILNFSDDTPHNYKESALHQELVLSIIRNLTNMIQDTFPHIAVYPSLGNHDWSPRSQVFPRNHVMYDKVADIWSKWLTTENIATFKTGICI